MLQGIGALISVAVLVVGGYGWLLVQITQLRMEIRFVKQQLARHDNELAGLNKLVEAVCRLEEKVSAVHRDLLRIEQTPQVCGNKETENGNH